MRSIAPIAAAALLLGGCGGDDPPAGTANAVAPPADPPVQAPAAVDGGGPGAAAPGWDLQSSGEGVALALPSVSGGTAIRLFCAAGENRLLVNVPAFRPIGSEERLSFGTGGAAAALVADPRGDGRRGGVSGTGAVPDDLGRLLAGPVSASYGAQGSGPHPPPPGHLARAFAAACHESAAPARPAPVAPAPTAASSPCLMQGSERLSVRPIRAIGTEPFWGARIEGRCVTYSHPDDQAGTRIWTRFTPGPGGGTWAGALGGRRFELRIRPQPGCSDGMSDRRYPLVAELLVAGEQRRGCAEPL